MKRTPLAVPLIAAGLAACVDNPVTLAAPPTPPVADAAPSTFILRVGLAQAVDDARSRVFPTLGTTGAIHGVNQAFAGLSNAVQSGDAAAVRNAIDAATGTLNALERSAPEADPVEVAALRLVLVNANVLFPAP
jgi:hypothetical protein